MLQHNNVGEPLTFTNFVSIEDLLNNITEYLKIIDCINICILNREFYTCGCRKSFWVHIYRKYDIESENTIHNTLEGWIADLKRKLTVKELTSRFVKIMEEQNYPVVNSSVGNSDHEFWFMLSDIPNVELLNFSGINLEVISKLYNTSSNNKIVIDSFYNEIFGLSPKIDIPLTLSKDFIIQLVHESDRKVMDIWYIEIKEYDDQELLNTFEVSKSDMKEIIHNLLFNNVRIRTLNELYTN
eukprot:TRINITY_DN7066_c0_g1_i1.p1 TRINITY_DN7066_c0_g1~~TRINITY_DN7066_c0_g1_i1.p1  ORF type:complete len:241 (+),score=29.60 TRINITY_DN7066_c0_g1_i1:76-798(+)